jgi:hypothetical protein
MLTNIPTDPKILHWARNTENLTMNHNRINNVYSRRPSLWSSSQSSWLQIQRPGFDTRCYQIFWEVVGLERGSLGFVSTTEELLERKSNGSGLDSREYVLGIRQADHVYPLPAKFDTNLADKRRSLGRYISLVDSCHAV